MRLVRDTFHGFRERPHYDQAELEDKFERIVVDFLKTKYGKAEFPFRTDDITTLIERDVTDLDQFADLSKYGTAVEGVTEFRRSSKPKVLISNTVHRYENRLRTTLTHEYGHVILHGDLFATEDRKLNIGPNQLPTAIYCKRDTMISARKVDWMEWQAGFASGAALMPKSYVYSAIAPIRDRMGVYGQVEPSGEAGTAIINAVIERFQVSREAATVRLKILGFLGAETAVRSLFS
jgi:Zn-dependent peptidase ImmA (M78 family)